MLWNSFGKLYETLTEGFHLHCHHLALQSMVMKVSGCMRIIVHISIYPSLDILCFAGVNYNGPGPSCQKSQSSHKAKYSIKLTGPFPSGASKQPRRLAMPGIPPKPRSTHHPCAYF